jgi:hypothetical protein
VLGNGLQGVIKGEERGLHFLPIPLRGNRIPKSPGRYTPVPPSL